MELVPTSIRKLSLLLAALTLCGGQWAVLQMVAWTGMAINYSSAYGLREGLKKTFDGSTPCSMCKKISQAKKTESSKTSPGSSKSARIEAIAAVHSTTPFDPFCDSDQHRWPEYLSAIATRSEPPLLPPPREA